MRATSPENGSIQEEANIVTAQSDLEPNFKKAYFVLAKNKMIKFYVSTIKIKFKLWL